MALRLAGENLRLSLSFLTFLNIRARVSLSLSTPPHTTSIKKSYKPVCFLKSGPSQANSHDLYSQISYEQNKVTV